MKDCINMASKKYKINPFLLYAIAIVESGMNARALHVNKDGTKDYGMFQINEDNLKRLNLPVEYAYNPCTASFIASYILKDCIRIFGETLKAIDCYNRGLRAKEDSRYVYRILRIYKRLVER